MHWCKTNPVTNRYSSKIGAKMHTNSTLQPDQNRQLGGRWRRKSGYPELKVEPKDDGDPLEGVREVSEKILEK